MGASNARQTMRRRERASYCRILDVEYRREYGHGETGWAADGWCVSQEGRSL